MYQLAFRWQRKWLTGELFPWENGAITIEMRVSVVPGSPESKTEGSWIEACSGEWQPRSSDSLCHPVKTLVCHWVEERQRWGCRRGRGVQREGRWVSLVVAAPSQSPVIHSALPVTPFSTHLLSSCPPPGPSSSLPIGMALPSLKGLDWGMNSGMGSWQEVTRAPSLYPGQVMFSLGGRVDCYSASSMWGCVRETEVREHSWGLLGLRTGEACRPALLLGLHSDRWTYSHWDAPHFQYFFPAPGIESLVHPLSPGLRNRGHLCFGAHLRNSSSSRQHQCRRCWLRRRVPLRSSPSPPVPSSCTVALLSQFWATMTKWQQAPFQIHGQLKYGAFLKTLCFLLFSEFLSILT